MVDIDNPTYVPADHPAVVETTNAVQSGDVTRLDALIGKFPWLPMVRFGDPACYRTLLHAATDWPGYFPNGPEVVRRLVSAGADVNAQSRFDSHTETPVVRYLVERGADVNWVGWDNLTPLGAAERAQAHNVANWLSAHGARRAAAIIEE